MPQPLSVKRLDGGLNQYDEASQIKKTQAAYANNFLFGRGIFKTPYGFAQLGSDAPSTTENVIGIYQYKEQTGTDSIIEREETPSTRGSPIPENS